jgi:hypothetical protein
MVRVAHSPQDDGHLDATLQVVPSNDPLATSAHPAPSSNTSSNKKLSRRQSTTARFVALPLAKKELAFGFRPLIVPRTRSSVLATLVVCTLLQLMVGAPYAANELAAHAYPALRIALRGVNVSTMMYFILGPSFMVNLCTMACGGFQPRYLLTWPITLGVSIGAAFIPVDGSRLGIISIGLLTFGLTFLFGSILLNAPFHATDEHKLLDQNFGPPTSAVALLFFGLISGYVTLTQAYPSPLVGLLLPIGSSMARVLAIFVLARFLHTFYYEPKEAFLSQLPSSAESQLNVVPPLFGDIESICSYTVTFFSLIIGNAASVAAMVEVMLTEGSKAWVLSFAASTLIEVLVRTGMAQRVELAIAARLAARLELEWPMRLAQTSALKLVYLRSLGGTGYVAPIMALCIGGLRAATFGDPGAIVWLDVSLTVRWVLLAQFVFGAAADATVWVVAKKGKQQFKVSERFAAGHPLRDVAFRDCDLKGYVYSIGVGSAFIYTVYVSFLGPAFVTGMCRGFAANATQIWVLHELGCPTAVAGLMNGTNVARR